MSPLMIVLIIVLVMTVVTTLVMIQRIFSPRSQADAEVRSNLRTLVSIQRTAKETRKPKDGKRTVFDSAEESKVMKTVDSKLTLRKRLKFGQWKMSPAVFRLFEILISLAAVSIASIKMNIVIQGFTLLLGPIVMRFFLTRSIERRFKAFDADYPQFLMSLLGLLKTGMNPMTAIEAASQGLEQGSLVRREIELMMERLRYGVPEEKSIGSFGEDIFHPEIELFVQALILSRRVGGTLSDTLERLAKQVRKRQFFRNSAVAAVGQQRGSIWFIVGILAVLEMYLYVTNPDMVSGAWKTEAGWQVWQTGIVLILIGIFWVRQVTKIKI